MYKTVLMAIQEGGSKLVMMDGTIWVIKPEDMPKGKSWKPPAQMEIKESNIHSEYDYTITNLDEEKSVHAYKRR